MVFTLKSFTLLAAVLITGLSAGFFYAWEVTVIPGTRLVADRIYLETMQSINRAILNPAFFLIFMGSPVLLVLSTVWYYPNSPAFWLLLVASLCYLIGTFGVTGLGNVPLNDALDALNLDSLSVERLKEFRTYYETRWNRLHLIRTIFSVLSFLLSLLAFKY